MEKACLRQPGVRFLSTKWVSYIPRYGELTVLIGATRYKYCGVSPFTKQRFNWLSQRNAGRALALLRPHECWKLSEDGAWVKAQ